MHISDIVLKKVSEPPFNTIVFNAQNDVIFPCIVKDGQYFSENGRLSNFWRWINLYTMKEESGYGCFYVATSKKKEYKNERA